MAQILRMSGKKKFDLVIFFNAFSIAHHGNYKDTTYRGIDLYTRTTQPKIPHTQNH